MDISGAAGIVTGGASGLGAATVRKLAAAGVRVVVLDLQDDLGEQVAAEVNGAYVHADGTNAEEVQAAVDAAMEMGPLRVLVNCAGIGPPQRTLNRDGSPIRLDYSPDDTTSTRSRTFGKSKGHLATISHTVPAMRLENFIDACAIGTRGVPFVKLDCEGQCGRR